MENDTTVIINNENNAEKIQTESIAGDDSTLYIPEVWNENWNNLLNSWYIRHYTNMSNHEGYQEDIPVSDSVYIDRLSKLTMIIELPYNDKVKSCIDYYVDRHRTMVEYMLGLGPLYFPMIEETLDKYDLPLELKYLIIVESALNPVALSPAGASGLWQFMLPTGKLYGLEINNLVDERRDPVKATDAACRFLKDLYATFGDWNLAIAAYNCGGGCVNRAIKRSGGKTDFWKIYPYLPKETRAYVPFFIAANYVMNYYAYHQLRPVKTTLPTSTDTVMVNKPIHFDQVTEILKIDKEEIRVLNPQYKKDIIPGNTKPRPLKLPAMQTFAFVEVEDSIADYNADVYFKNRTTVDLGSPSGKKTNQEKVIHKVASGETMLSIANKYGVTSQNIRKWNGLKSNKVAPGRNLTLYVDSGGLSVNSGAVKKQPATATRKTGTGAPTKKVSAAGSINTPSTKSRQSGNSATPKI
ncbi:lytic transglycosylase [Bacteroidia bacterium]|nr:lytic transglycosylase [Bacteroidia bacterium]